MINNFIFGSFLFDKSSIKLNKWLLSKNLNNEYFLSIWFFISSSSFVNFFVFFSFVFSFELTNIFILVCCDCNLIKISLF